MTVATPPAPPTTPERAAPRGRTTIADGVVAKLAARAARQTDGVVSLGGSLAGALSGVVGRLRGDDHRTAGVGVELGQDWATVDLALSVRYPLPVAAVTGEVRRRVIEQVHGLTGLEVPEVNIEVTELVTGAVEGDEGPRVA